MTARRDEEPREVEQTPLNAQPNDLSDSGTLGGLHLWPAATCLISELAEELASLSAAALRETEIVLPTQRLATWLTAMLATQRGAFVPPVLHTMESFVHARAAEALPAELAEGQPLTDLEQELLLASLLKEAGYRHIRLGHEHEVKQLFAELAEWELEDEAFPALERALAENIYLSEGSLDTLGERVRELQDLHQRFAALLRELGASPSSSLLGRQSRALAQAVEGQKPLARRLYMVGFTSMGGHHARLLRALVRRPEVQIWVNEPPALSGAKNPLQLFCDTLGVPGLRRQPRHEPPPPPPLLVAKAESVLAEVAHAITLAQEAVREGVPPSAIALLVTNDAAYGKPLRTLLPGSGLAYNLAIGTPLLATPLGTWLLAFLDLAGGEGEEITQVLALAAHPLTLAVRGRGLTRERLYREVSESGVSRGLTALGQSARLSEPVAAYLRDLKAVLDPWVTAPLRGKRPMARWTDALVQVVSLLDEAAAPTDDDIGVALSSREALAQFTLALTSISERLGPVLTKSEFLTLVRGKLLGLEVRSVGDPLYGVQVLSVEEARYVPFDVVIVMGCAEGDFPRALPKDHILDHYLKTRIGLPGWQLLEAIEDTTFHLLRARLPELILTYPATQGSEPVVRSRFIETALVLGEAEEVPVVAEEALLALVTARFPPAAPGERVFGPEFRRDELGAFLGEREALFHSMSASALESLIRCPYRFLLERLGVRELALGEDDAAQRQGDWLHDVLEAFFTGRAGEREVAEPLALERLAPEDRKAYALARLEALTERLAPAAERDLPLLLHLKQKSWPAFADHVLRLYGEAEVERARRGWRERSLEQGAVATVRHGADRVRLKGRIDSVDLLGPLHVITDYKRRGLPERKGVLQGVSPQLLLYALALELKTVGRSGGMAGGEGQAPAGALTPPGEDGAPAGDEGEELPLSRAVVGYWSILKGTWQPILAGSAAQEAARQRGLLPKGRGGDEETLDEAVRRMLDLWRWRHEQLARPEVPFAPDPSACDFCRMGGICRRDDPELSPVLEGRDALARRLAGHGGAKPALDAGAEVGAEA